MAEPVVFEGQQIRILIGDGADPQVFAHPCLINMNRALQITPAMIEEEVYDCTDPDAPATVYVLKSSVKLAVSGSGKIDTTSLEMWIDWALGDEAKDVRVELGGRRLASAMKCTEFSPEGEPKKYATASIGLASHGKISHVPVA